MQMDLLDISFHDKDAGAANWNDMDPVLPVNMVFYCCYCFVVGVFFYRSGGRSVGSYSYFDFLTGQITNYMSH